MILIIKIDTNSIERWDEIINKHRNYIKDILNCNINKIMSNTDLIYLFTGINNNESIENAILEELIKCNIVNDIALGKKENWKEYISRFEKLYKDNRVIIEFLKSKSNKENIISNLSKKLNKKKYKNDINKLSKLIENEELGKINKEQKIQIISKDNSLNKKYNNYIEINEILREVFNYENFQNGIKEWNRNELLFEMDIRVCPYCNRQYITKYKEKRNNKSTADLDHFYPQSKYPFLALSLYNFVPSCQICNRNFKNASDKELLYPYEEEFDDKDLQYKFRTEFDNNYDFTYLLGENINFNLKIDTTINNIDCAKKERAKNSKEIFKLEEVYEEHKNKIKDIIKDFYYYNNIWQCEIKNLFDNINNKSNLLFNEYTIEDLYLGKYLNIKSNNQDVLSKLISDIVDEIKEKDSNYEK